MSSNRRYDAKRDASEPGIVTHLEAAGFEVTRLAKPVDLHVRKRWWPRGVALILEVKTLTASGKFPSLDKRQISQNDFIARGGAVKVGTPDAALSALRDFELVISP